MDPLVPNVDAAIARRIHADLDHGIENLARCQPWRLAVDDPNKRENQIDGRAALDHAGRSAGLLPLVVATTPCCAYSLRHIMCSLMNSRIRLINPTKGRIGASTSKI